MPALFVDQVVLNCREYPERIALGLLDNGTIPYGELLRHIAGVYTAFRTQGIGAGTPVILAASKGAGFVYAYLALHALNAIAVPLDPQTPESRLRFIQNALGYGPIFWPNGSYGASNADVLDEIVSDEAILTHPTPESTADIMFTSGTTGASKGVVLTHANLASAIAHINTYIGNRPDDRELCPMPLSHSFGLARMRCTLFQGAELILAEGVSRPKRLFETMEQHHVTGLGMVGPAWTLLHRLSGDRISKFKDQLRYIEFGSAMLPVEEKRRLMRLLPSTQLIMHYGLTEASRAAFLNFHAESDHLETVGKAGPLSEIAICDSTGQQLPAGEKGEICIRGGMVSKKYVNAPSAFFDGVFFRSGDLGYMDNDGYITLIGRIKEIINVGGEKVSPLEVEAVLNNLPGVVESACTAMPDPILGEVVAAFIVPELDAEHPELSDILPMLKVHLESFKLPKRLIYIDALPHTVSGKIQRSALKEYL